MSESPSITKVLIQLNNYHLTERTIALQLQCHMEVLFCTGLVLYDDGYFDGYDPTVNPGAGGESKQLKGRFGAVSLLFGWLVSW